ncbi:MAG: DMT family transporter [Muribaculaceae bacterium]|nr:DMT family transporter [Muribaculaceae bacterium]
MNTNLETQTPRRNKSRVAGLMVNMAGSITILMWGLSFISTKVLLEHGMGPVEIYIYRFAMSYLVILLFCHSRFKCHSWRDEGLFVLCGLTGGSIYFIAENTALEYTLVQNVSLLTSLSPLITAMLAGLMYSNEKPSRGMMTGSFVAFIGVGCVIFNSSTNVEVRPLGDLLSIAAAFSWAVYSLVLRRLNSNYDVWFVTRKSFFYGVITSLPFLTFSPSLCNPLEVMADPEVLINMLFLGLGASMIAYVLWSNTVKYLGAVKASNFMYFQSVVTMIASYFILGEAITVIGVLGCLLIIGGLWLGDWLTRRANNRNRA